MTWALDLFGTTFWRGRGRRWWWPELMGRKILHIHDLCCGLIWFVDSFFFVVFNLVVNGDGPQSLFDYLMWKWFFHRRRLFCPLFFIADYFQGNIHHINISSELFSCSLVRSIPFHINHPPHFSVPLPSYRTLYFISPNCSILSCVHIAHRFLHYFERKIDLTSTNILRLFPFHVLCVFCVPLSHFVFISPSLLHFICLDERKNDGKIHSDYRFIFECISVRRIYIWHACVSECVLVL